MRLTSRFLDVTMLLGAALAVGCNLDAATLERLLSVPRGSADATPLPGGTPAPDATMGPRPTPTATVDASHPTPSPSPTPTPALQKLALKVSDEHGQVHAVDSPDDVKEIRAGDRVLEEGGDYVFEDGKLVFTPPTGESFDHVSIELSDGIVLPDIALDPGSGTTEAGFYPNATGEFIAAEPGEDPGDALQRQLEEDRAHRVTVETGLDFAASDVVALGFRPAGKTDAFLLPDFALEGRDGGVAFDVQALGSSNLTEDLKDRVWILVLQGEGKYRVVRFKIAKELERPASLSDPEAPLPDPQLVAESDISIEATVLYDTEAAARAGEHILDALPGSP